MSLMLTVGAFITIFCKIKLGDIASTSVFKSGMVACICVLGVAWLGDTFVSGHTAQIKLLLLKPSASIRLSSLLSSS